MALAWVVRAANFSWRVLPPVCAGQAEPLARHQARCLRQSSIHQCCAPASCPILFRCSAITSGAAAHRALLPAHPLRAPPPQFYTAFNPDAEYQRIQRARQRLAQIRANVENTAAQLEAQEAAGAGWAGS